MKRFFLILIAVLCSSLQAQERITPAPAAARVVLEQTVVPQKDGGSVTFQKIAPPPPAAAPMAATALASAVTLSAEDLAVVQRQQGKEVVMVSLSATVHGQGTLLYCMAGDQKARALSRLDFRLLEGTGTVETETQVIPLFLAAGGDERPLASELATQAQTLAADGFMLLDVPPDQPTDKVVAALQALHAFISANQTTLAAQRAQRQAEQAARNEAERNAPPAPPKHRVIQFWPLSTEQKAALRAARDADTATDGQPSGPSATGGTK